MKNEFNGAGAAFNEYFVNGIQGPGIINIINMSLLRRPLAAAYNSQHLGNQPSNEESAHLKYRYLWAIYMDKRIVIYNSENEWSLQYFGLDSMLQPPISVSTALLLWQQHEQVTEARLSPKNNTVSSIVYDIYSLE